MRNILELYWYLIDVYVNTCWRNIKIWTLWQDLKNSKIFFKIKKISRSIDYWNSSQIFFDHYEIHWLNNQPQISQYQYPSIIHDFVASFAAISPSIIANNRRFMSSLHLQLSSGIYNLVYRSHPIVHLLYLFLPLYFPLYFILQFSQCNSFSVLM